MYSLTPAGTVRWRHETTRKIYASPVLLADRVYVASGDGFAYCWSTSGSLQWKHQIGRPLENVKTRIAHRFYRRYFSTLHEVNRLRTACSWASPNIDKGNTLYVTGYDLGLHAIDAISGTPRWQRALDGPRAYLSGVAIAHDGTLFVASQQRYAYRFGPDGSMIWRRNLRSGFNTWGSPSIDSNDGAIYFPCSRREHSAIIYSFDIGGQKRWVSHLPSAARGAVTISYEDYVIVACYDGVIRLLDKQSGRLFGELEAANMHLWTSCVVDPNGHILVTTMDSDDTGSLVCYDATGNCCWRYRIGRSLSAPVIDERQRIYISDWDGYFYCLNTQ